MRLRNAFVARRAGRDVRVGDIQLAESRSAQGKEDQRVLHVRK
jgi:hypothetical protein